MKKIAMVVFAVVLAAGILHAEETNFGPKGKYCVIEKIPTATSPAGAVVETVGVFVGKIASAVEIACTGERKITVENETGDCKIFPFCATTKVIDESFGAVTFDKLKKGESVKVDYAEDGGIEKAKEVTIQK